MIDFIRMILNILAKYKIKKNKLISFSDSARINFRGIRYKKNCKLTIGKGSIIEGNIIFDKENAEIYIGDNTFIGGSNIISTEKITIGDDVLIAWGCTLIDNNSHSILWEERALDVVNLHNGKKDWEKVITKPIEIKNKAWIGLNTIVLKGVTIEEGAVIGAGSVVTKNIPPYTIAAGNPAAMIKKI